MIYLYWLPCSPSIPKQHGVEAAGWYAWDDVTLVADGPHPTREEALQSMMSDFEQQRNPFSDAWVGMYSDLPSVVWEPVCPVCGMNITEDQWKTRGDATIDFKALRSLVPQINPQSNEIVHDGTRDWADAPCAV